MDKVVFDLNRIVSQLNLNCPLSLNLILSWGREDAIVINVVSYLRHHYLTQGHILLSLLYLLNETSSASMKLHLGSEDR